MYFDIVMPVALFLVTLAAVFLNDKVEAKLKGVFEEKEFSNWNAVILVAAISITVSLIVFVPQVAIMTLFLFAYSMVLFIFGYLFSDLRKRKAQLFSAAFLVVSIIAATASLLNIGVNGTFIYGTIAFFGFFAFSLVALLYDEDRRGKGERWYLAIMPPTLFIMLYAFFSRTPAWFPYLLDSYGVVFAVMIILYLGSLFSWKAALLFIGLLTVMDTILVLFTGTMVSAARQVSGLRLPVLVTLPTLPAIATQFGTIYMSLGLGDFFFAGLIGIQTMKKFGRNSVIAALAGMTVSFFIFETFMLNYEITALPGTLMIVCGWLPVVIWKSLKHQRTLTGELTKQEASVS